MKIQTDMNELSNEITETLKTPEKPETLDFHIISTNIVALTGKKKETAQKLIRRTLDILMQKVRTKSNALTKLSKREDFEKLLCYMEKL
jgi:hypothetical protein